MPNLLVLDASSSFCSVAISYKNETIGMVENQPRRQAQCLIPMIDALLSDVGASLNDVDGIAFGRGPGSFTGLRIVTSVAQGISLGLDKPVCGISSLQALAHGIESDTPYDAACVMNAHMGEVFWGAYRVTGTKSNLLVDEQVGSPEQCIEQITKYKGCLLGNGLSLNEFSEFSQEYSKLEPEAKAMVPLAFESWDQGLFGDPIDHTPVYLRKSVAWKKLSEQPSLLKG